MTGKLKTLKEMDWIQKDVDGTVIATDTNELKQEIINWIKSDRTVKAGLGTKEECDKNHFMNTGESILKHIFNINDEEDLEGF